MKIPTNLQRFTVQRHAAWRRRALLILFSEQFSQEGKKRQNHWWHKLHIVRSVFLSLETSWCQNRDKSSLATESQLQNLIWHFSDYDWKEEGPLMNPVESFIKMVNIAIDIRFCIRNNLALHNCIDWSTRKHSNKSVAGQPLDQNVNTSSRFLKIKFIDIISFLLLNLNFRETHLWNGFKLNICESKKRIVTKTEWKRVANRIWSYIHLYEK